MIKNKAQDSQSDGEDGGLLHEEGKNRLKKTVRLAALWPRSSLLISHILLLLLPFLTLWLVTHLRAKTVSTTTLEKEVEGCTYDRIRNCSSRVTWSDTESVNKELSFPCCNMFHYSQPDDEKACLRDRHIVFYGDSVTRYTYLNLVDYIESGYWQGPEPYSEVEVQWGDWTQFYEGTNTRLNGNEICDCSRSSSEPMETILENRYYFNQEHNIRVSYIQLFKHEWGSKGHNLTWLGDSLNGKLKDGAESSSGFAQTGCPAGQCGEALHPLHWHQGVIETLEGHIADLEPDVLVFNTGFWDSLPGGMEIPRIAAAGHRAVSKKHGTAFFKTTTTKREDGGVNDEHFSKEIESYGWKILDTARLTADLPNIQRQQQHFFGDFLYWDTIHFLPQGKVDGRSPCLFSRYVPFFCNIPQHSPIVISTCLSFFPLQNPADKSVRQPE